MYNQNTVEDFEDDLFDNIQFKKPDDDVDKSYSNQPPQKPVASTLPPQSRIQQCLQPLYNQSLRIRISIRLPNNERYLVMLDKYVYKNCNQFIEFLSNKFQLQQHYREGGFLVRELTGKKIDTIYEINKDDQLVILSDYLIKNYNPNPEELLQKRQMPNYFEIFGFPQNISPQVQQEYQIQQNTLKKIKTEHNGSVPPPQMNQMNFSYQRSGGYQYQKCAYYYNHWAYDSKFSELEGFIPPMNGVPPPRKLREKFDYLNMENVELWVETPDFLPFANGLDKIKNREDLIHHLRSRAGERGFRLILPYGKPDEKQYVTCSRSGKKKSATSKKSSCPFSLIYKKAHIGNDPTLHPAYNPEKPNDISEDGGKIGIYYLSKFRGLHNHPLEMSFIYAENQESIPILQQGTPKKLDGERELMGRYESDALEELLVYESKKFDKVGPYTLKVRNQANQEIYILNPECGTPTLVHVWNDDDDEAYRNAVISEARDISLKMFDKIETMALEGVKRDFSRKTSVFVYQEPTLNISQPLKFEQQQQPQIKREKVIIEIKKKNLIKEELSMIPEEKQEEDEIIENYLEQEEKLSFGQSDETNTEEESDDD